MGRGSTSTTREISYAYSAQSKSGRALIRIMENTTGRLRLIKRAEGYERQVEAGGKFFEAVGNRQ